MNAMKIQSSVIDCFDAEYAFLSNFYEHDFEYKGLTYKSGEHAFQAAKCLNPSEAKWVYSAPTPGIAKRRGRQIALRSDWEQIKDSIMYELVSAKFAAPELAEKLLATGDAELIEGNYWHDNCWGVCSCGTSRCQNKHGENRLGKILMKVRSELLK